MTSNPDDDYPHAKALAAFEVEHLRELEEADRFLDEHTALPLLERLGRKLLFILNQGLVAIPRNATGAVVRILVSKITNESCSFCGSLRAGSLLGATHHVRALMEIEAAVTHLFADEPSTPRRISQFMEYERMLPWLTRRRLEVKLEKGQITQETFNTTNLVSDDLVKHATREQVATWIKLFDAKDEIRLLERNHWHSPSIKKLLLALDTTGYTYRTYEIYCHGAHVSPAAHRLASPSGPRALGYEPDSAIMTVNDMFGRVYLVLDTLHDACVPDLRGHFYEEAAEFESINRHEPDKG